MESGGTYTCHYIQVETWCSLRTLLQNVTCQKPRVRSGWGGEGESVPPAALHWPHLWVLLWLPALAVSTALSWTDRQTGTGGWCGAAGRAVPSPPQLCLGGCSSVVKPVLRPWGQRSGSCSGRVLCQTSFGWGRLWQRKPLWILTLSCARRTAGWGSAQPCDSTV